MAWSASAAARSLLLAWGLSTAAAQICSSDANNEDDYLCRYGAEDPVCDQSTNTQYRNRRCANCNNVANYAPGSCGSLPNCDNVISDCATTSDSRLWQNCRNRGAAEPVGFGGRNYFNHFCAVCAGALPSEIDYSVCGAAGGSVVGDCPEGANSNACYNFESDPVCYQGQTFRNRGCATCHYGEPALNALGGACDSSYHPCNSTSCGANSHCALSIIDCAFDFGATCNWQVSGATIVSTGSVEEPRLDHTFASPTATRSGFLQLSGDSSFTSPPIDLTAATASAGSTCTLSIWIYSVQADSELRVSVRQGNNVVRSWGSSSGLGGAVNGWTQAQISLTPYADMATIRLEAATVSGQSSPLIMVDDVQLVCEEIHGDGICACDNGYQVETRSSGYSTCEPLLSTALATDESLSQFRDLLGAGGYLSRLSDPSQFFTVLAPTNDAFSDVNGVAYIAILGDQTQSRELGGFHLTCVGSGDGCDNSAIGAVNNTGIQYLQDLAHNGRRSLYTLNSGQTVSFNYSAFSRQFTFGNAIIVGELGGVNGVILKLSSVLFPDNHPPPSTNICGQFDCGDDNGLSTCRAPLATVGHESFVDYNANRCPCGPRFTEDQYVCGSDDRSYRSVCHLNCESNLAATPITVAYPSACAVATCVCNDGYYRPDAGQPCVLGAPTSAPTVEWNRPAFSPTPAQLQYSTIEFYVNGTYFRVVQERRMMMDEVFSQSIREKLESAAGLTHSEIAELSMHVYPSSRMPGYILLEVSGPSARVLSDILVAVEEGRVGLMWAHSDYQTNPDALQPTYFQAFPMYTDRLPPIVRYNFWVDVTYEEAICRTSVLERVCTDEFINQEDFAGGLRWHFRNQLSQLASVANTSLVHLWPTNSSRPGIEGKVEMIATALQINARLILDLRRAVESGQSLVMVMDAINSGDEDRNYVCKPLPSDSRHERDMKLVANIGQYPGSPLLPPTGSVDVREGPMANSLEMRWSLVMSEPFRVGGIHIHSGYSCQDPELVGGHWYRVDDEDPWNAVQWTTDFSGIATASINVYSGWPVLANAEHAVVVHSSTGARIGCGTLSIVSNAVVPPERDLTDIDASARVNGVSGESDDSDESDGYNIGTLIAIIVLVVIALIALSVYFVLTKKRLETQQQSTTTASTRTPGTVPGVSPTKATIETSTDAEHDSAPHVDGASATDGYMDIQPSGVDTDGTEPAVMEEVEFGSTNPFT